MENSRTAAKPSEVRAHKSVHEVIESADFKHMVNKRWTVSLVLLALLFVSYYGFVVLIAVNREFLSSKIGEFTTLGIPLGIAVIVFAFVLTAYYIVWANQSYDPEVERLKGQLKQ